MCWMTVILRDVCHILFMSGMQRALEVMHLKKSCRQVLRIWSWWHAIFVPYSGTSNPRTSTYRVVFFCISTLVAFRNCTNLWRAIIRCFQCAVRCSSGNNDLVFLKNLLVGLERAYQVRAGRAHATAGRTWERRSRMYAWEMRKCWRGGEAGGVGILKGWGGWNIENCCRLTEQSLLTSILLGFIENLLSLLLQLHLSLERCSPSRSAARKILLPRPDCSAAIAASCLRLWNQHLNSISTTWRQQEQQQQQQQQQQQLLQKQQ